MFALAAVTAALGLVGAIAAGWTTASLKFEGDISYAGQWSQIIQAMASVLVTAALPVGVLLGGGALLRLQAVRLDTDLLDDADDELLAAAPVDAADEE